MFSSKEFFFRLYNGIFIIVIFQIIALLIALAYIHNVNQVFQTKISVNTLFYNSLITEKKLNAIFLTNFKNEKNYTKWKNLDNTNNYNKSLISIDDIKKIANNNTYHFLEFNELLITNEYLNRNVDLLKLKTESNLINDFINFVIAISESEIKDLIKASNISSVESDFQILNNFDAKLILSGIDLYYSKIIYNSKKIKPNILLIVFVISINFLLLSLIIVVFRKK